VHVGDDCAELARRESVPINGVIGNYEANLPISRLCGNCGSGAMSYFALCLLQSRSPHLVANVPSKAIHLINVAGVVNSVRRSRS
jgi:hypothetical protein